MTGTSSTPHLASLHQLWPLQLQYLPSSSTVTSKRLWISCADSRFKCLLILSQFSYTGASMYRRKHLGEIGGKTFMMHFSLRPSLKKRKPLRNLLNSKDVMTSHRKQITLQIPSHIQNAKTPPFFTCSE